MTTLACTGIFVVDDDDDVRDTFIQTLTDEGYPAFGAANGKEALGKLRDGAPLPCVILLDMMMPVMDGRAFRAEQLQDGLLSNIPVVVLTAHADIRGVERDLRTGVLRKPISLAQLFEIAATHCGKPTSPRWSP